VVTPASFRWQSTARPIWALLFMLCALCVGPSHAQDANQEAWAALKAPGAIVLFRHALAPGGGDPPGLVLGDCATQRNLSTEGREQARRMGDVLRQRGVVVGAVWHSQWCRTQHTAQLAFADPAGPLPQAEQAFNSFFENPQAESAQSEQARRLLLGWRGPGTLVVVTHQVNITALTGVVPQSGEGVVLRQKAGALRVQGKVLP